jgi:pimeloyl-[acyl-carrier protein] synthase
MRGSAMDEEAGELLAQIINPATDGHRYPLFERLRDIAPVHRATSGLLNGWYVVSGYENCRSVMLASEAVSNSKALESMNIRDDSIHDDMVRRWMAFRDEVSDHDRLRKLFFPHFTPRAVNQLRANVQELIDELLDGLVGRGSVDVFTEFCYALPSVVVARMLGIPSEDMVRFQHILEEQVAAMASVQHLDDALLARKDEIASELLAYFRKYLAERRADPQDDLITKSGLAAPAAGVEDADLLSQYVFVLIAGHSTTSDAIGNALIALDANRDQLQLLLEGKVEMRQAVDELMRYDSSIATVNRVFAQDYTVAGNSRWCAGHADDAIRASRPCEVRRAEPFGPHPEKRGRCLPLRRRPLLLPGSGARQGGSRTGHQDIHRAFPQFPRRRA